jgi:hypothetical protein
MAAGVGVAVSALVGVLQQRLPIRRFGRHPGEGHDERFHAIAILQQFSELAPRLVQVLPCSFVGFFGLERRGSQVDVRRERQGSKYTAAFLQSRFRGQLIGSGRQGRKQHQGACQGSPGRIYPGWRRCSGAA